MAGPNRIDTTPVRMSTNQTVARQTPKSDFGDKVQAGLNAAASAVAQGAAMAAPLLPGGHIVSAAVSSLGSMGGGASAAAGFHGGGATHQYMQMASGAINAGGGSGTGTGGAGNVQTNSSPVGQDALSRSMDENKELLNLQIAMQRENQVFSTVSNVLKVRHDTVKNSIANVR